MKDSESNSQKLVQKTQQIALLRKQLKTKDDEIVKLKDELEQILHEKDDLQEQVHASEAKIDQLELHSQRQQQQPSSSETKQLELKLREQSEKQKQYDNAVQDMNQILSDIRNENDELRDELIKSNTRIQELLLGHPTSGTSTSSGGDIAKEILNLKDENMKLRKELSAFDLEFFEEIENLKFAYSEAMKKIKIYENLGRS